MQQLFLVRLHRRQLRIDVAKMNIASSPTTSFPGSLSTASLGRWKKDPGCGWSRDHPESGW